MQTDKPDWPKTLPTGFDYEIPLSLNAETCLSEFKNVVKPTEKDGKPSGGIKNINIANMVEDMEDTSDFLYNAYSEAHKSRQIVKKIRRLKSVSPARGAAAKSPGRHRSPPRGVLKPGTTA